MPISLIANVIYHKNKFIIGHENDLVIRIKEDMNYFKRITSNKINSTPNIVLMGRKTWFSIPQQYRPLKNRINFVLTNDKSLIQTNNKLLKLGYINQLNADNVYFINMKIFTQLYKKFKLNVYVIGGSDIYNIFLDPNINFILRPTYLYITEVKDYFKYNKYDLNKKYNYINHIPDIYKLTSVSSKYLCEHDERLTFRFLKYTILNDNQLNVNDEKMYINMLKHIMNNGNKREDRTGTGTVSIFGTQMRFDISKHLPLLTTRSIPLRVIIEELLWFLRGDTDAKILQNKDVHIWDGNTSREFLDNRDLHHYEEGILGPGYGFQMRFFGAKYSQAFADTSLADTSKIGGFDQLKYILNTLNTDPYSRRMMMSYWNPPDFDKTALIPCFTKNTLVLTNNGYKKITNVLNTDLLYSHNGNWQKIINKQQKVYTGDIYTFYTDYNPSKIKCTKEHPFYIKKNVSDKSPFWCDAKDIKINDLMCYPINKLNEIKYNLIDEDIWFIMGYFVHRGIINNFANYIYLDIEEVHNKKSNKDIEMNLHDYIFNKLINNEYLNIISKYNKQDDIKKHSIYYTCDFNNVTIQTDISITNITTTDLNNMFSECYKNIPEWVQNAPKEYISHFLEGYFYGYRDEKLDSCMVYNVQRLLAKIDCKDNPLFNSYNNLNYFNDILCYDNEYIYYKVIDIKQELKTETVYNFEVDIDNSYTVCNVAVHNCHTNVQFYVEENPSQGGKPYLSCQFYMRSNDFALANNFNVISYSILTYILALKCNMQPKEIIYTCGDTHIYKNHINPIKEQLERHPRPFPILLLNDNIKKKDFNEITYEDFELIGYYPYSALKLPMAV